MLRVWTNAPRWRPLASFRTWLTRIAVNLCIDRKRRPSLLGLEAAGDVADPAPDPAARHEQDQTSRDVAAAIAKLPARRQTLLSKSMSFFGMESTYACTIAILRRIFSRELERLASGPGT